MMKLIQAGSRSLLWAILFIVPLESFWLRLFEPHVSAKLFFLLSDWYELGLFVLFIFVLGALWRLKLKFTILDWLFFALGLWALVSNIWSNHSLSYHIIGLRYSILPVYTYFLARLAALTLPDIAKVIRPVAWIVILTGLLQVMLWYVFPSGWADFLGWQPVFRLIVIPQAFATLPGPNQYASYLLLLLALSFGRVLTLPRWLIALALVLFALTFSRGALLGLLGMLVILFPLLGNWRKGIVWGLGGLVGVIVLWLSLSYSLHGQIRDIFTHGASYTGHKQAISIAFDRWQHDGSIVNQIIGYGAGEAGPATFVRSQSFIPESWYLQILYEYGLIGLLLFVTAFCLTIREALRQKNYATLLALTAIGANTLFLHVLSDNPAATTLLFALVATVNTVPLISE